MNMPEQVGALVRETFASESGEFHPCALFDEPLDCIRVITRDCSFTEIRIDDRITVLEDNYCPIGGKKYVGFTIKGARHFCQERGFRLSAPIKLIELLNAILDATPDPVVRVVVDGIVRPLVEEGKINDIALAQAA
jgi:hypothetical protein